MDSLIKPFLTSSISRDEGMAKVLGVSKVTRKYQVTIPKIVREKLEITENDLIIFIEENGKITIKKTTP